MATGKDPHGLVPGLAEATARHQLVLATEIESPGVARAYALQRVRAREDRVELILLLFGSTRPSEEAEAIARVRLRFGTADATFRGRVDSLIREQPRIRVAFDAEETLESLLEDLEPSPRDPKPARAPQQPVVTHAVPKARQSLWTAPLLVLGQQARLVLWSGLLLSTSCTWHVNEQNRLAARQTRFNHATQARAQALAAESPAATPTSTTLAGPAQVEGDVNPILLDRVMLGFAEQLDDCYFAEVDGQTLPAEGRLGVQLTLNRRGEITKASFPEDGLGLPSLRECAEQAALGLQAPAPRDGGLAFVGYTFSLAVK